MEYRVLGTLEVVRDGRPVDIGQYKRRAVLALLLINAGTVVSTDRIIDEIWDADSGRDRQNSLWVVISALRGLLDPDRKKRTDGTVLLTRSPGYLLAVDQADIDAARFEHLATEGRALLDTDPGAASLVLNEALALWRGQPYAEFTYEPFAHAEIARLDEMRMTALEDRILADLGTGRSRELVGELEALVRQHPLRERLTAHLMVALHRSGRQADALRAYAALRGRLAEELGVEPSADIVRLEERIVVDDPGLATASAVADGQAGLVVRGYELRDRLGESPVGYRYHGRQPTVGRDMVVQVVRPELANDPDFIRRFEADARAVSALEHPHIVPLHDFWREPDAAYLVSRRSQRGNLRDLLDEGPLPTELGLAIIEQVAGALRLAHGRGVVHGDLKPEAILIDDETNAYITDFGIALSATLDGHGHLSPEQLAGHPPTSQSDVYALGAVAAEVLRGSTGESDAPLVGPAAAVIARAMSTDPADRHPGVEHFVAELAASVGAVPQLRGDIENPYQGLRAFDESDAARFFGRERLVERLLARLGDAGPCGRLIAVVGPSGAGKSSVVRAGVVPAVRAGALPESDRWFVTTMTPGEHPFEALETALLKVAVDPPAGLLDRLTERGISDTVAMVLPEPGTQLLLVVDQLEELFTHAAYTTTQAFLDALAAVAGDARSRVRVVVTLRADFYDHPLRHQAFGELLRLGTEVITPMSAQEVERAVAGPAEGVGVRYEQGLVARVVADMQGQAAALPLLQYALTELFDARDGATIPIAAYESMGGVSAALVRRADSILGSFDADLRAATRDVFLRLVSLGDGSEDTRRRVLLRELADGGGGNAAESVIDTFGRHRLLSFDRDPLTRGPTVELAHEALLTEWKTLRHWIGDARADVEAQRRLATAAAEWRDSDREPSYLLTGDRLGRYVGWDKGPPVRLTGGEGQFLAASNEGAEEQRLAEQRRVRRLRRLVVGVGVALVVALIAGALALRAQHRADDEAERAQLSAEEASAAATAAAAAADLADLQTLIARSAALSDDNPEVSLLLALEANRRAPSSETEQAILSALGRSPIGNRLATTALLSQSGEPCAQPYIGTDGSTEFVTVPDGTRSLDILGGQIIDHGPAPAPCHPWFADLGAGRRLAHSPEGDRWWFAPLDGDWGEPVSYREPLSLVSREVVGDRVLARSGPNQENVSMWLLDATTGDVVGEPARQLFYAWAPHALSADGAFAAFGAVTPGGADGRGLIHIRDARTGEDLHRIPISWPAMRLAFDQVRGHLLAVTDRGKLITVDPATGEVLADVQTAATSDFVAVGSRSDGLVVAVSLGGAHVIDRFTGNSTGTLELQDVVDARVRPDGSVLVLFSTRAATIYDLDGSALVDRSHPVDPFGQVQLAEGQAFITAPGQEGYVRLDLSTGERDRRQLLRADGDPFPSIRVSADADGVWSMAEDMTLARFENGNETESARPDGDLRALIGIGYADQGTTIGLRDGQSVEVLRLSTAPQALGVPLAVSAGDAASAAPARDGGLHIMTRSGVLKTYDASGAVVAELDTGIGDLFVGTADSSGSLLAFGGSFGAIIVDTTDQSFDVLPDTRSIRGLGFAQDGEVLIMVGGDGEVRLWDTRVGGSPTMVWNGTGAGVPVPPWYDDSTESVWVVTSGLVIRVPLTPERWRERACELVGRELTQDEWDRFVPGDEPRQPACG
ncbi:MAG: BTAD domain-containing putative transcriptional regulator [Actinomycetota bacterium]